MLSLLGLGWIRMAGIGMLAGALFFIYSWGSQIITNYGNMASEIAMLKRSNALINSRVNSYKILMERRDAAIAASRCAESIQKMVKNPDTIPRKTDPFVPGSGG